MVLAISSLSSLHLLLVRNCIDVYSPTLPLVYVEWPKESLRALSSPKVYAPVLGLGVRGSEPWRFAAEAVMAFWYDCFIAYPSSCLK